MTSIRPAKASDAAEVCRIFRSSVKLLCSASYSEREIAAWIDALGTNAFLRIISEGSERMFIAEIRSDPLGFSSIRGNEITAVFVDPERGRGAGALLLSAVEDDALQRGITRLFLRSTLTAFPFYLEHGYQEGPRSAMMWGDQILTTIQMTKDLKKEMKDSA